MCLISIKIFFPKNPSKQAKDNSLSQEYGKLAIYKESIRNRWAEWKLKAQQNEKLGRSDYSHIADWLRLSEKG